jgi:hypothetical protein
VASLVSRNTVVPSVPEIEMPKFVAGLASQPLTKAVTSTKTNALAAVTGALVNAAAVEGPGDVTVPSLQADVTWENVRAPGVVTLLT